MKKLIFIGLLFSAHFVFSQSEITRQDCYNWARENYPNLKQSEIYKSISELKMENLQTNFLPSATLKGQATYQSEVTKIDVPIPNIEIPSISKDQYKVYLEFQQTIWDGGLTNAQKLLEDAALKSNLSQLETELYQLNEKVNQAWFSALAAKENKKILEAQIEVLEEKIKALESGMKNGVVESTAQDVLQAEILNVKQSVLEIDAGYQTALRILSVLTGKDLDGAVALRSESALMDSGGINRPELVFFDSQRSQLDQKAILLDKSRNPKVFGFGQGGAGRPGLNMLSNNFDPYYLVGVGVSWNVLDWKKTQREKQVVGLQKELIDKQKETFEQNISLLLAQQQEAIQKTEKLIASDKEIINLRKKIADASASKLENGTINSADYIADLNAATIAMLKLETHKVQLQEATVKYNTIKGTN